MEGSVITDPVHALQELEITSAPETGPGLVEQMATISSGQGHGSEASYPQSLTQDQQVQNLKENLKRVLTWTHVQTYFDNTFETNPWFARVVSKLLVDPCLDIYDELEIDELVFGGLMSEGRMTSLDVAILMGDLKMVQKILERSSDVDMSSGTLLVAPEKVDAYNYDKYISKKIYTPLHFDGYISKKTKILYTPLHLAVVGGNIHIVDVLLEKGADVNAPNWLSQTPLDLACKMESIDMLQKLVKEDIYDRKDALHVAVQHGNIDFMKKLPSQNVNARDFDGRTPLHYLAASPHLSLDVMTNSVKYLAQDKTLDIKALDGNSYSAFYVTVRCRNIQMMTLLLESFKEQIRLNEACDKNHGPPIQIAFEGGDDYRDIEATLMEYDRVKGYMEILYRDRQVYVDAANAILVGAALIASVTFASWLQPPLSYTSYSGEGYSSSSSTDLNYVDVAHNIALRAFWIFNALSFYFAIAVVVCGARSVLPRSHLFIKKTVEKLRTNLLVTSILLACSVLFVIIAFAIAGTIVLTPLLKYQWYMIVPTFVGGMVCIISLCFLIKSMKEICPYTRKYTKIYKALDREEYIRGSIFARIERDLEKLSRLREKLEITLAKAESFAPSFPREEILN